MTADHATIAFSMCRHIKRKRLRDFAKELNNKIPKSELWFKALYKLYQSTNDEFNKPFHHTYIPDVLNRVDNYIIEIDGSIHNTPKQILKDIKKDKFYLQKGYTVLRVIAYDVESFNNCISKLLEIRRKNNPHYSHPKRINI